MNLRIPFLLCGCLALAACRKPEMAYYAVAKPPVSVVPHAHDHAHEALPESKAMAAGVIEIAAPASALTWTAPASWQAKPLSPARLGSYAVRGLEGGEADFAITTFPGDVGGEFANVNRWRGQVGLPPLAESELSGAVSRFEHNGLRFAVVDLGGGSQRLLGAIVPHGAGTWFFKLLGPDAVVAAEKPAFLSFLQTVQAP